MLHAYWLTDLDDIHSLSTEIWYQMTRHLVPVGAIKVSKLGTQPCSFSYFYCDYLIDLKGQNMQQRPPSSSFTTTTTTRSSFSFQDDGKVVATVLNGHSLKFTCL